MSDLVERDLLVHLVVDEQQLQAAGDDPGGPDRPPSSAADIAALNLADAMRQGILRVWRTRHLEAIAMVVDARWADVRHGPVTGAELIAAERARQVSDEGYTPEHDATHRVADLVDAATAYLAPYSSDTECGELAWPWDPAGFKPQNPVRDLVRAGALIAAAIDRLQAEQ